MGALRAEGAVPLPAADRNAELQLPAPSGERCEEKEEGLPSFPGPVPPEPFPHSQAAMRPQLHVLNHVEQVCAWLGVACEASNSCGGGNSLSHKKAQQAPNLRFS